MKRCLFGVIIVIFMTGMHVEVAPVEKAVPTVCPPGHAMIAGKCLVRA